ncbi:glycosyl transferase [Agromyces rhizosphaerae]|uniref:D-inositol 3-phosphate glycosyltransferase n=1 Tax=Agromyces rhizosphaerae TaxID=88374 RepID=A0A9W6CX98_9MICO|nr:glycosyltransferase [Agromyces rhizosphaerae]GLI27350.1 glycosyl transferase [Agromyces rhizosphaerae]
MTDPVSTGAVPGSRAPRPDIVLAHDYLVQSGGAERVVAHWAEALEPAALVTLAYRPETTFDAFDAVDVRATIPRSLAGQVERMLPALPSIAARTRVTGGDVALVSSSGWAHRFAFDMPHVVYVHSPARWLYAADDYRMRLSRVRRAGLTVSTPMLRRGDADAMRRADAIVANSAVTRDRIRDAYGVDAEVVHPPVSPVATEAVAPSRELPDEFAVVVARDRGYKNVALAVESALAAGLPVVVVGAGSEELDAPDDRVHGLGRVSDAELCWTYRNARVVVGAAREDFGLTVLEASFEGTPAAVVPAGGYLETVRDGANGFHAADATSAALAEAIVRARDVGPDECRAWAERFGVDRHLDAVVELLEVAAGGSGGR